MCDHFLGRKKNGGALGAFDREEVFPTGPWNVDAALGHAKETQQDGRDDENSDAEGYEGLAPGVPEGGRSKEAEEGGAGCQGVEDGDGGVDGHNLTELGERDDGCLGEWDGSHDGGHCAAHNGHANVADGCLGAPLAKGGRGLQKPSKKASELQVITF